MCVQKCFFNLQIVIIPPNKALNFSKNQLEKIIKIQTKDCMTTRYPITLHSSHEKKEKGEECKLPLFSTWPSPHSPCKMDGVWIANIFSLYFVLQLTIGISYVLTIHIFLPIQQSSRCLTYLLAFIITIYIPSYLFIYHILPF